MSILTFPSVASIGVAEASFSLVYNTQSFASPLNKSTQTLELPGAMWSARFLFKDLFNADSRAFKAFLAQLRGMSGRFYLGDLSHLTPRGTAGGAPLVKGAGQVGSTLLTDGWPANQSGVLLPGDYYGVNGELKIVTAVIPTDSGGNATISFEPPLRSSPPDNAAIVTSSPSCVMRLVDDKQDNLVYSGSMITSFELNAIETFA